MIVIFIDDIEDFVQFLDRRVMDEIFYEFKELKGKDLSNKVKVEIILHFLAKVDDYMILYETMLDFKRSQKSDLDQEVIKVMKQAFSQYDNKISLIKGKIREIFLSYSS
ncbi:MAG: hypothetical protein ACOC44_07305 [Promethearchaeia archaeon]